MGRYGYSKQTIFYFRPNMNKPKCHIEHQFHEEIYSLDKINITQFVEPQMKQTSSDFHEIT